MPGRLRPLRARGTCPLVQIDEGTWLLELFHGPTLAFKDVAMQILGDLFDHVLAARGERITIVGATSGDTGSAAIEACRDRENVDIVILHPKGRTSEVQRRQMTTVEAANVHNVAVEGTFDDCQALVKAMFADPDFRDDVGLAAVNSINFARILAQTVYYVTGAVALGAPDRPVNFAVPTGNFGNVFAGHAARRMGVPIETLTVASNANDILTRFFETGRMETQGVVATHSPSMDIQVSSNFERLLYELMDGDGRATARAMQQFKQTGAFALSQGQLDRARAGFDGYRLDDPGTLDAVARLYAETGMLIDPHSAIGLAAARERRTIRRCRRSRWRPRIRPSSPTRCTRRPASARPCRRGWPICTTGRSATPPCPTSSPGCRPSSAGSAGRAGADAPASRVGS